MLSDISQHRFGSFTEHVLQAGGSFASGVCSSRSSFRDTSAIKPGQKILINGAGGGAGSFAVQITKALEAEVTGVDSTVKLDSMGQNGVDHVMDYTKEDFTKNGEH